MGDAARDALGRVWGAIDEVVDYRALVPLRIAAGPLVLLHLAPYLGDAASGVTYASGFTVPYGRWYPQLPEPAYLVALVLAVAGAVLMSAGLFTRVATAYTAMFVVYNLFLSRTNYHHNAAFLSVLLVGLALVPAGNAISLDAWRARRRGRLRSPHGPRWPLMLLRFQVAAVYLASGVSKLLDPDWFGGVVTRLRVERQAAATVASGVPQAIVDIASTPQFHAVFAKVVVLTEIFIGLGLLVPRLRTTAIWIAVAFHVAIALTAEVQVFSWAALAALTMWVAPHGPDRLVVVGGGGAARRRWRTLVQALDWTGRFRVAEDADAPGGLVLHDRNGTVCSGPRAMRAVAALLPATFFFTAPLRLVDRVGVESDTAASTRRTG